MFTSNLALAVREIRKNLFRSSLTILGVVIGVAAVVTIITLGNGASARITDSFSGLGANILIISPGMERRGPGGPGMGITGRPFTLTDVEEIRKIPGIRDVAPLRPRPVLAKTDFIQQPVPITMTTPDYLSMFHLEIEGGETFAASGENTPAEVILGHRAAEELFDLDAKAVVGQTIDLNGSPHRVVGVLKHRERGAFGFDHDGSILVQLDPADQQNLEIAMMFVSVDDIEQITSVKEQLTKRLRENREIAENQKPDFQIRGIEQIVSTIRQVMAVVTTVIGLIAAISLLVGGIGIMNVMLVTVTERTREIGVRIAIGAEPRDVMLQFIVEACMLTAFGGLVGIALGLGAGAIAAHFVELPFQPSPLIIALVFLFSIFMGVLFGFLPARRAAKINPIDALRHE